MSQGLWIFFIIFSDHRLINLRNSALPADAVFIGRPSLWGNPYKLALYSRKEAIRLYEIYLFESGLIDKLHILKFKTLACYCYPSHCHGEVLLRHLAKLEA